MSHPEFGITRHDTAETLNLIDTIMNEITRGEPDLDPKVMNMLRMQDTFARDLAAVSHNDRQAVINLRQIYESNYPELVILANNARQRALGRLVCIDQQVSA